MKTATSHSTFLVALAGFLALAAVQAQTRADEAAMTLETFLDKLMMVESGGRIDARNPRSTAVGPYQFIASTWLQIARKSFAEETKDLAPHQILELRLDPKLARRAAKIYTGNNAAFLSANGEMATFAHLRLAFLTGPGGAVRVLAAKPETPLASLLGQTAIGANPFMRSMTAGDLIERTARDIATQGTLVAAADTSKSANGETKPKHAKPTRPKIEVACDLARASCRRWLFLAERRVQRKIKTANR